MSIHDKKAIQHNISINSMDCQVFVIAFKNIHVIRHTNRYFNQTLPLPLPVRVLQGPSCKGLLPSHTSVMYLNVKRIPCYYIY